MRSAVLAGGNASRYEGKAKGLEKVGGERILDRVVRVVRAATASEPILVANAEEAHTWIPGLEVVGDVHRNCGSLGGLHAAIAHDDSQVFVVAWDMPFVTVELVELLVARAKGNDVVVPESDSPYGVEPMCAIYGPACLAPIEAQIEDEDFRASGFHDKVKCLIIPREKLEPLGDPELLFFNVNTPDDLKEAEERWRKTHA